MDYKDYQYSRDAAWRILIDCHTTELPVRALAICQALGIPVRRTSLIDAPEGRSAALNGRPLILLAEGPSPERRRFTLAHELGHIILGHVGRVGLLNREPSPEDDPLEQAANVFASRLLARACVLWGCNVQSAARAAVRHQPNGCAVPLGAAAAALSAGQVLDQPSGAAGLRTVQAVHRSAQAVTHWGSCLLTVDIF